MKSNESSEPTIGGQPVLNPPTDEEIRQFIEYLSGGVVNDRRIEYEEERRRRQKEEEEGEGDYDVAEEEDESEENGVQKRNRTASMYFYRHHYLSIIQEEEESADHQQAATPASSRRAVCRLYFFDIPLNWNEFSLNLFDGQVKGKTQFSARQTCNFPAPRNPEPV